MQGEQSKSSAQSVYDSFTEALSFITAYYGQAHSPAAIQAGMPLKKHGISPKYLCMAAEKKGFHARILKRALKEIIPDVLPCVLVLKSKTAVVLLGIENRKFRILEPVTKQERLFDLKEIQAEYTGHAVYIKPLSCDKDDARGMQGHWFWSVMLENIPLYMRVLLATFLINCFALTGSIYVMNVYNRVLPANALETGWVLSIGAASVYVFDFVLRSLRSYFIDIAGRRSDVISAERLYNQVLEMRLGTRPQGSIGAFANTMRDFDALREFFNSATMTAVVDFPFSLIFIVAIGVIAGFKIALLLLLLYVTVMVFGYAMQFPVRTRVKQAMMTAEKKHGILVETISSLEMIRGVSGEGPLRSLYGESVGRSAEAGQHSRFYSGLSVHFSALMQQLSSVLIILCGMYAIEAREMTTGALMAGILLSSRAIAPVGQMAALVNKYHQMRAAYRNLDEIMRLPVERPIGKKFLHRPVLKGNFVLRDVEFMYPSTSNAVLKNLNISIRQGERVAIVGRIGSGKSTVLKMMLDFYEPTRGAVLVDDTDMRQIDPADLRKNIGYMGQETALLTGSIRDNIVMACPHARDEDVLRVAEMAGVHDFVKKLPMGYDTPVGERGERLSGGQRQAVALTRTLLMNTQTLVMDEPTNSMDPDTERRVLKSLEEITKDKTLVLVTHKPVLLSLVQRVIVMDGGRVVMDGPVDKVMHALANGQLSVPQG